MLARSTPPPRRTHRKRFSASRLSSDTTATLPEYHQSTASSHFWNREVSIEEDIPSDKPPDYPDSAEEADEDTDSEDHRNTITLQQQHLTGATSAPPRSPHTAGTSPRRRQRFQQHKRKHSIPPLNLEPSTDPYLDSLLERSVHALEMSNTLLQSSMTTHTSLSTILTTDAPAEQTLEARAVNLSAKIQGKWDEQEAWADDLEEITRKVDSLFGDRQMENGQEIGDAAKDRQERSWHPYSSPAAEGSVSCSLPSVSPLQQRRAKLRRPSLDLRQTTSETTEAGLRLSHRTRDELIDPPPRALTQYVESSADPAFITLPSTLGLRSGAQMYPNAEWNASTTSLHSSPALPVVTDKPLDPPSTPAYAKLASLVIKRPSISASATPPSSFTPSFLVQRRHSSAERGRGRSSPLPSPRKSSGSPRTVVHTRPETPHLLTHRPMTPTAEESSSSDSCVAKQTIVSLRKILDEQPKPDDTGSIGSSTSRKRAPAFMPRTPARVPVSGTSTATASISRMLTKKVHHSSTRPPSPPRQSALKGSRPATPISATLSIPESSGWRNQSASSSGRSTPKRISFAELPEAHVSSRPEKFQSKGRKKGKGKERALGTRLLGGMRKGQEKEDEEIGSGWLSGWFGSGGGSLGLARHEQRMEDKMSRSWGGRLGGGYGYMDEWAV